MKRGIVWFKSDLRLHDNETLHYAITHFDQVIPVFCLDDRMFEVNEIGFKKHGAKRVQFLLETLVDLDQELRKLKSGLLVLRGLPEVELPKLAALYGVKTVVAKKEVAFEEKAIESTVEKELWVHQCKLETFSTSTLYHAEDLPFGISAIPDVFTVFRKRIEKETPIRSVFPFPTHIESPIIEALTLPTLAELGYEDSAIDDRAVLHFKGGETEALKRLDYYFFQSKFVSNYKETRNGLIGESYSSKFSPWLALGCLSPREIYEQLKCYEKDHGANDSTYWLVFELLWRDYFRFMMKKHREKFFLLFGLKSGQERIGTMELDKESKLKFESWMNGETGEDFVDANMIELKRTGFMSNRGRQNAASYLIHDLKVDWRFGAAYFEEQLIDYDVCSNWGNWAYIAGVGNDPRPDRYFNIEKQASTYDKKKTYRKLWLNRALK